METSAELLYLLKFADKNDVFGFKDELERNECLQWLFFWHGSGAPYQGQTNHFYRAAKEKMPCMFFPLFFSSFFFPPCLKYHFCEFILDYQSSLALFVVLGDQ